MTTARAERKTFLSRLLRNEAGNTLMIAAAAFFPLAAMIGGGLDVSRTYVVRTRLSQACDAGVLAGRRALGFQTVSASTLPANVTAEVTKFVNFNFPQNYMGSTSFEVEPTPSTNNQVLLTLSTQVPTTIMRIFGKTSLPVTVTCNARNDYSNIDIVLVLDTTGSMACSPARDAGNCVRWINKDLKSSDSPGAASRNSYGEEIDSAKKNVSRIQALRAALTTLQTQVGAIETDFNTAPAASRKRVRWAIIPFSQMVNAGKSVGADGTTLYDRHNDWFNTTGTYRSIDCTKNDSGGNCTKYKDLSSNVVAHNAAWLTTWDGCVEERSTTNSITSSSSTVSSSAVDLIFDAPADSTASRWTVADASQVGDSQYACPRAMSELQTMTSTAFNDYFLASNGFQPEGGTYLDVGMLWAARLLSRSSTALWASDNPVTYNGYAVSRYVIFMTDGYMDTGNTSYSAYAQEISWKRTTSDGLNGTSDTNHSARLAITCSALKNNMGVAIFAISFGAGSTLSSDLMSCSSDNGSTSSPNFSFKADNAAALSTVFSNIGQAIGSLRLSQ